MTLKTSPEQHANVLLIPGVVASGKSRSYLLVRTLVRFVALALITALVGFGVIHVAHQNNAIPAPGITIVVLPGDTLWSIATQQAPKNMDVREYIWQIEKLNNISASLQPGQRLVLPASSN